LPFPGHRWRAVVLVDCTCNFVTNCIRLLQLKLLSPSKIHNRRPCDHASKFSGSHDRAVGVGRGSLVTAHKVYNNICIWIMSCGLWTAVVTIGVVAVIALTMSMLIVCIGVFCFRGYRRLIKTRLILNTSQHFKRYLGYGPQAGHKGFRVMTSEICFRKYFCVWWKHDRMEIIFTNQQFAPQFTEFSYHLRRLNTPSILNLFSTGWLLKVVHLPYTRSTVQFEVWSHRRREMWLIVQLLGCIIDWWIVDNNRPSTHSKIIKSGNAVSCLLYDICYIQTEGKYTLYRIAASFALA